MENCQIKIKEKLLSVIDSCKSSAHFSSAKELLNNHYRMYKDISTYNYLVYYLELKQKSFQ